MNKTKVIKELATITLEQLTDFFKLDGTVSGDEELAPIKVGDEYFALIKSINETTFQPAITFVLIDQDHRIKFNCMKWLKTPTVNHESTHLKKVGELWKDYNTPRNMEKAAFDYMGVDKVVEVRIQKITNDDSPIPSYALLVRYNNEN